MKKTVETIRYEDLGIWERPLIKMKKMGERIVRLGKNGGCRNMKKTIGIKKGIKALKIGKGMITYDVGKSGSEEGLLWWSRRRKMVRKKKIINLRRIIRRGKGIENRKRTMTKIEAGKAKYLRGIRTKKCNKVERGEEEKEMKKGMKVKRR